MTRYISLYRYFLVQRFKILLEYRLNFFIGSVSTAILQAASHPKQPMHREASTSHRCLRT